MSDLVRHSLLQSGASGMMQTGGFERTGQRDKSRTSGYNYFPSQALNPVRSDDIRYTELELFKSLNDRELMVLQLLPKVAPQGIAKGIVS